MIFEIDDEIGWFVDGKLASQSEAFNSFLCAESLARVLSELPYGFIIHCTHRHIYERVVEDYLITVITPILSFDVNLELVCNSGIPVDFALRRMDGVVVAGADKMRRTINYEAWRLVKDKFVEVTGDFV